jgi:hypothetical protein
MKFLLALVCCAACAHTVAPPDEALVQAISVLRDARGVGADADFQARAAATNASTEIDKAMALMRSGRDAEATAVLKRARVDGELALQLAKEASMRQRTESAYATVWAARQKR